MMEINVNSTPNRRKRQYEPEEEEDCANEGSDLFNTDDASLPLRQRKKQGRRVSGVYRELKSLHNIGQNATVMELVFSRMTLKEVMDAGVVCSFWYIIACRVLRKQLGASSMLRLWNSINFGEQHLWLNWELHYHDELLGGTDEDENMENISPKEPLVPSIQAVFSVGNHYAHGQYVHEDSKLPFRQDYVYAICRDALITAPNFSFTSPISDKFQMDMVVESLFIPKSSSFTVKGFGLDAANRSSGWLATSDATIGNWSADEIKGKLELPKEDTGSDQELRAVFMLKYMNSRAMKKFRQGFAENYPSVGLVSGTSEEIGCNRCAGSPEAVGFSFYCGPGATIGVYVVDFQQSGTCDNILEKMKAQADSSPNGFCLVLSHDSRPFTELPCEGVDADTSFEWSSCVPPEPETENIVNKIRSFMPRMQLVGVRSIHPVEFQSPTISNVKEEDESTFKLAYAFLMLTF